MAGFFHLDFSSVWRRYCRLLLALAWVSGLVLGLICCLQAGDSVVSVMRSLPARPVSIVSMLFTAILPFLITAAAVFLCGPFWLPWLAFARAFCFSYGCLGVCVSFGSSGWLLRWLLLFSRFAAAPCCYWYLVHSVSGEAPFRISVLFFLLCLVLLFGCLDCCIISPFLVDLIDFMKG